MSESINLPAFRFTGMICKESDVKRESLRFAINHLSLKASSSNDADASRILAIFCDTIAEGKDAIIYKCPSAMAVKVRTLFTLLCNVTVRVFNEFLPQCNETRCVSVDSAIKWDGPRFLERWEWVQPSFFSIDRSTGDFIKFGDSIEGRLPAFFGGIYCVPPSNAFGKKIDDSNKVVLKVKASGVPLMCVTPATYDEVIEGVGRYWSDIYTFEPELILLTPK